MVSPHSHRIVTKAPTVVRATLHTYHCLIQYSNELESVIRWWMVTGEPSMYIKWNAIHL